MRVVKVTKDPDPAAPWLCYDQSRTWQAFLQPDTLPSWVRAALSIKGAAYFEAVYSAQEGTITSWVRRVRDASW